MHLQPVENIHISIMYYTYHHFPIRGKEIVSTKLRPKSAYDLQFIVCLSFVPGPRQYISYSYGTE